MADVINRKSEKSGLHEESYSMEEYPLTAQPKRNAIDKVEGPLKKLGYKPVQLTCVHCKSMTTTNLAYHIPTYGHLSVFICSLLTWPCGLCFISGIPYCLDCCHKVDHHCSVCNTIVGHHSQW